MDLSKLRQQVGRWDRERRKLLGEILQGHLMVAGSLYQMRRRCGNARCRCARGELHASWYLSRGEEGRTRLTYIGKTVPEGLERRVGNYRKYQKLMTRIRQIDAKICEALKKLRAERTQSLEQAREGRS